MKKSVSILLLILIAGQMSATFVHLDCTMDCCQEQAITCCEIEKVETVCPSMVGECSTIIFLPLLSAVKEKTSFEIQLQLCESLLEIAHYPSLNIPSKNSFVSINHLQPPGSINLPLLI